MSDSDHSEQWMPVKDYEHSYSVSSLGRVRRDSPGPRTRPGLILVGSYTHGYRVVILCGGKRHLRTTRAVHRMVAVAFLGQPPEGKSVNHKNGDKADNRLSNLEYITHSENVLHAIHVLKRATQKGELNGMSKLKAGDVLEIRKMRKSGSRFADIAAMFSINANHAALICRGESWRHLA